MSFRNVQQNSTARSEFSVPPDQSARGAGSGWIRNPVWPALPSITASDEKIVGLYAVYPNSSSPFAIQVNVTSGTVRVDWGDGTAPQTYTSASLISYMYDYNAAGLANTDGPVTFTDAGDLVTRNNHGYTNNYPISFASITTTTGITAGQIYYVINVTTNTFQLAATPGGSAIPLTNDGTGTILPYKIATVTITPNTGGATITNIDMTVRNSSVNVAYGTGWLDLSVACSATTFTLGSASPLVRHTNLEQARILRHRTTSLNSFFQDCGNLQNVVEITAAAGINVLSCSSLFSSCRNLIVAPFFNTASVTAMGSMFLNCASLTTVPLYNTAAATNMSSMFANCFSLKSVPLFNTAAVTNMSTMFASCFSLESVPLFNTAAVTDMNNMFFSCQSLPSVPLFNTAAVTDMNNMFNNCRALTSVPLFNTAAVTNMNSMFTSCSKLVTVPAFNMSAVTNMNSMFQTCASLITVPAFTLGAVAFSTNVFNGCTSLTSVPALNLSTSTAISNIFASCTSLQQIPAFNLQSVALATNLAFGANLSNCGRVLATNTFYTFSVANYKLSASALDELYTNLPTVQPAGTSVTFTGNPTNTVTLNNHGYANLRSVVFATVGTSGLSSINYYVRNATLNTFQISSSPTGSIITFNNGTGTLAGQTITVTGNWGTAADTPSIATAKGWTVTGS